MQTSICKLLGDRFWFSEPVRRGPQEGAPENAVKAGPMFGRGAARLGLAPRSQRAARPEHDGSAENQGRLLVFGEAPSGLVSFWAVTTRLRSPTADKRRRRERVRRRAGGIASPTAEAVRHACNSKEGLSAGAVLGARRVGGKGSSSPSPFAVSPLDQVKKGRGLKPLTQTYGYPRSGFRLRRRGVERAARAQGEGFYACDRVSGHSTIAER